MGKKCIFPFSLHFPLASCLHLSFSPPALLLSSPSLHRGIQSLHWETKRFEGDPELRCSLPLLPSLSTALPFLPPHLPSTLSTHPSALRGPGFRSTQGNHAPNPSPGLALLPQASQAVPLHRRLRGGRPGRGSTEGGYEGQGEAWGKDVFAHIHYGHLWQRVISDDAAPLVYSKCRSHCPSPSSSPIFVPSTQYFSYLSILI